MGLLDEGAEYLRRSGRNLGGLFDWLAGGAQAGADPLMALYRGDAADQPFLPTADSGGRIGAIASAVTNHAIPGTMPAGALGTYGGIGAKTANKAKLGQAQRMIERGMDPEHTRKTTGWFQDPAGDWKFEISDHRAEIRRDPKTARDTLYHPELRRAYPDLIDTLKIEDMPGTDSFGNPNPVHAAYFQDSNTAKVNRSAIKDSDEMLKVLMHELQHGVQGREGFSPGTNQSSDAINHLVNTEYWPKYDQIQERTHQLRRDRDLWIAKNTKREGGKAVSATLEDFYNANPDWAAEYDALLAAHRDYPRINDWTFQKYNSALGEVEARDTMNRVKLTPDERRQFPPYATTMTRDRIDPGQLWDVRDVMSRMYPKKAADVPEPPELRGLLNSTRLTPEQKGMLGSLLGIGLAPDDAE